MDLEIEGLQELIQEMEKIEKVSDDLKDEALIEGGEILKDSMKKEVYRNGLNRLTGEAQEAIIRTDPKDGSLYVGTQGGKQQPGFYLYMHEFGYFNVWAQRFIAPKPFASIAFENSTDRILNKYVEVFQKGLKMK